MAYYAQGKEIQISEPSILTVQAMYADAVSKATSVAVIGVRPNIDDRHVWAGFGPDSSWGQPTGIACGEGCSEPLRSLSLGAAEQ